MTRNEYLAQIMLYFKHKPSFKALEAMAVMVNDFTEDPHMDGYEATRTLHTEIFGPPWECRECGETHNFFNHCWSCDEPRPEDSTDTKGDQPC